MGAVLSGRVIELIGAKMDEANWELLRREIKNLEEGRKLVKQCYSHKSYYPEDESSRAPERYAMFLKLKNVKSK